MSAVIQRNRLGASASAINGNNVSSAVLALPAIDTFPTDFL